jgi:hypothetical protein
MRLMGDAISISTEDITFRPELSYGVNEHFVKVFILSYVKLLSDSPLHLGPASDKPKRLYLKFFRTLVDSNISQLISKFSDYSNQILKLEYSVGVGSTIRVFHDFMKDTPIFKEYLTWYRTGDPVLLKYILSFLRFGKKLEYQDPEMDSTAFRGWEQVEDKLEKLSFSDIDISSLRNIVRELLPPLDTTHLLPRFGSGKVAERDIKDVYDKLAKLVLPPKIAFAFTRSTPFRLEVEGSNLMKDLKLSSDSRLSSRLKFVPKDISKSRSICMEPNAYMYFQQEVMRWMVRAMARGRIRKFVNLRDQRPNQEAARYGSKYLSMDTLDLSSASDSVHIDLVRGLFPRDWLYYMLATRTSEVETPDGKVRHVKKFAPMGSAVCFPTQCIIFTAACIYAYGAHTHGKTTGQGLMGSDDAREIIREATTFRTESTMLSQHLNSPVVFGDDIICDSRVTDSIIILLQRLGFDVNVGKSFTSSQSFRESCGVYCYGGQDVTPVLFRVPFLRKGKWSAKVYASIIGSINNFRSNGYHAVASFLLSMLKDYGYTNPLPFVTTTDAFGLFTSRKRSPKPKFLRWNADWQIFEERVQGIGPRDPRRKAPARNELYRMDQWWRSRIAGETTTSDNWRGLVIRPQETRLVPVWARCE